MRAAAMSARAQSRDLSAPTSPPESVTIAVVLLLLPQRVKEFISNRSSLTGGK